MSNKLRWSLALLLVAVLALTGLGLVSGQEGGGIQATLNNYLYLRVLPDIHSFDYGRLEPGTTATFIGRATVGRGETWVRMVLEDGTVGWGKPNAFTYEGDVASLPDALPAANQGVVMRFANVRLVPALSAGRIAQLPAGTIVTLEATVSSGDFVLGTAEDGTTGWVDPAALAFMAGAPPEDLAVVADGTGIVRNFANLRPVPDINSDEVVGERLTAGAMVTVLAGETTGDWYLVQAGDLRGWVSPRALEYVGGAPPADLLVTNATVVPESVNLRSQPSAESARLGWAYAGDRLDVVGQNADGTWYYVVPLSRVGAWVSADLVALDAGVGPFVTISAGEAEATEEAPAAAPAEGG